MAQEERRLEVAERERTNKILAQKNMPLPPKVQPTPKPEVKDEERPDRFKLIETE
jgi:hypothetical protein